MLEKTGSEFTATCDFCGDDVFIGEEEFTSAVDTIKDAGWKVFKQMGEWFHKCDDCLASDDIDDFEAVE